MIVVSDTSVITNLAQVGALDLLRSLYKEIIVPAKVSEELLAHSVTGELLNRADWISTAAATDTIFYDRLLENLDPGEAEAIVLATELQADLLLIDERKGRKIAKEHGLLIVGLLGVLIDARRQQLVGEVKPLVDRLITEAGFRVGEELYRRVLREVGEG